MTPPLAPPARCQVGAAQEKITPPIGTSLAGYFHDRVATHVHDDLFARAVVIESHGRRAAMVVCDLICVTDAVVAEAKATIQRTCDIDPTYVLVSATHTHTGPEPRRNNIVPVCEPWLDALPGRIATAVERAAASAVPATLHVGRTLAEGYSFNRLFRLRDGSEVFGRHGHQREVIGPAGPVDAELQTLSARDESGRLTTVVVNFACHPDVVGGGQATAVSADWPGVVADALAGVYGDHVVTLMLQGACGDINHHAHEPTHLPMGGPAKATQMGRALAGAAMLALERAEPMTDVPVRALLRDVPIPYYTRDAALAAEVDALRAKPDRTQMEQYLIERYDAWPHDGQTVAAPVHVLRIGDVGVVGFPAEMFTRIGMDVKHWSPAGATFPVELANARASTYVPTTDQAERGAYGAKPILSRWLCADAGRRMADAAQVMLGRLW